jgi:hypothetical protein
MILYHFTHERHVASILKHGLVPADDMILERGLVPADGHGGCVWLKGSPSRTYTPHDREIMPADIVCLQARIASDDRRLHQYLPWLQERLAGAIDLDDPLISVEGARDCWIYFGTVAPSCLRVLYRGRPAV